MSTPYDKSNPFGRDGYDAYGFDENGLDRDGYDAEGYDQFGFNQYGRDRAGRDRDGFYLDGYNDAGFDADGYDRAGFNRYGYDRTGHDRTGQRAPARPVEPSARDGVIGLLGGTVVTLAATSIVTALVVWLLRYMSARTPAAVWDQFDSGPPLLPSPSTAALCATGLAVLAIAGYVVMTVYTPGGAALFRLLVFLIGACLVIAMGNSHTAPTWIASLLIVAAAGAAISQLVPSIGPRIPTTSTLDRKEL
ncbi:hypothetical protein M0655_23410 (plasmid) [Gordonia amicalis]|uniref:hypothetical protein n=1 Tax=Gordonia amicalis TaxID=89053 RepID=UPI0015F47775|nr:hypothetical protein [Gordonia amicalis]MBA5846317.1 hypothetical protein [Gordonia amicalis]UOG23674.1 hypothetical protein MTX80_22900 [Gordonia amicalis]UPW16451.1 hypothetical protein M0655_23410 [Gordonia amicalis]